MRRASLAKQLILARTARSRAALLARNRHLADEKLAECIRRECYSAWTTTPALTRAAADAMKQLEHVRPLPQISAMSKWVAGIAAITQGQFEVAADALEDAYQLFRSMEREAEGAQAYVAKVLAFAMIGRYADAERTAKTALRIFEDTADHLAAGKIELNLSNLVSRQGRHRASEGHAIAALDHFQRAGEETWQAMAENSLANTYAELNELGLAEAHYKHALEISTSRKMQVTVAEIEASLGNLYILRGDYDEALLFLERSRRKYADLKMPHQAAVAELEMADIYLELNLIAEAKELYAPLSATFMRLRMKNEEARTRLGQGRADLCIGSVRSARRELLRAERLFREESNVTGRLAAALAWADLELSNNDAESALRKIEEADASNLAESPRQRVTAEIIEAEARLRTGDYRAAERLLSKAAASAVELRDPESEHRALALLGTATMERGDLSTAEDLFDRAAGRVQLLRSNLSGDEYTPWFLTSRMRPFEALARVRLRLGKIEAAFNAVEAGRSGALTQSDNNSDADPHLLNERTALRASLNAQYKLLDSGVQDDGRLTSLVKRTEKELSRVARQISATSTRRRETRSSTLDSGLLAGILGRSRVMVEFTEVDGSLGAFVLTAKGLRYFPDLCSTDTIGHLLQDLRFQLETYRYGTTALARFERQMKGRTDETLSRLGEALFGKLGDVLSHKQLVVVPSGQIFYLPLGALRLGGKYLVELADVSSVSSALLWQRLRKKRRKKVGSTLIVGVADERIPRVQHEVEALSRVIFDAKVLTGEAATVSAFLDEITRHDSVHLACHGRFRSDNPMFSSLQLADGFVTVRDLLAARSQARSITLSACETGLNQINPGNEILGLTRGFFAAGATSLIMSLWNVNDEAAVGIMSGLYDNLQNGMAAPAALRKSVVKLAQDGIHPYLWGPFIHVGA